MAANMLIRIAAFTNYRLRWTHVLRTWPLRMRRCGLNLVPGKRTLWPSSLLLVTVVQALENLSVRFEWLANRRPCHGDARG